MFKINFMSALSLLLVLSINGCNSEDKSKSPRAASGLKNSDNALDASKGIEQASSQNQVSSNSDQVQQGVQDQNNKEVVAEQESSTKEWIKPEAEASQAGKGSLALVKKRSGMIANAAIDFFSVLPKIGPYVQDLELKDIVQSAIDASDGDSFTYAKLTEDILQSILNGVKMIPEARGQVKEIEQVVLDSGRLLTLTISKAVEGKRINKDEIKMIAKTAIDVISLIPAVKPYIKTLDLKNIVDSAIDVSKGRDRAPEQLSRDIINSLLNGLKHIPEAKETMKTIDPAVRSVSDLLILTISSVVNR